MSTKYDGVKLGRNGAKIYRGVARNLLRGAKPGGLWDGSPQWDPGAEYGNPREHQRGRNKIDLR